MRRSLNEYKLMFRPTLRVSHIISLLTVTLALTIGFWIRILPAKYGYYLDEFDPYFHYYATKALIADIKTKGFHALLEFPSKTDTKFWYPEGRSFANSFAGLYYFSAFLYLILTHLGVHISLFEFLAILPAFIGTAIVIPMFLIGKKIGGYFTGALAAIITSVIPGFMARSSFGWYDNEPFALLFGLSGIFFVTCMFDEEDGKRRILLSILGGLFIGFANSIWGGARILNGVVGLLFLIAPLLISPLHSYKLIKPIFIFALFEIFIAGLFPKPGLARWIIDPSNLIIYLAIVINLVVALVITRINMKTVKLSRKFYIVLLVVIASGLAALYLIAPHLLTHRYLSVINPFFRSEVPLVQSVAEHQTTTGLEFLYNYGFLLFLATLGGFFLFRKKRLSAYLIALLFVTSLYFASSFARLQVYLSLMTALLSSVSIYFLFQTFSSIRIEKKRREKMGKESTYFKTIFSTVLILLLIASAWTNWIPSNDRGTQLSSAATVLSRDKVYDWIETLSWIRENIPENAVIISWWDYGYWISVMGNRTTVADNATLNTTRIERIALMYLSNETEAIRIMKELHGNYVLVFVTSRRIGHGYEVLGRVYSIGGDESKFDWMIAIAGLDRSPYIDPVTSMPTEYFWNYTLIGKLMPYVFLGYGHFNFEGKLVNITKNYEPKSKYYQLPLFKYKLKYGENAQPFRLVFKSSAQPHIGDFYAQVLIYELVD